MESYYCLVLKSTQNLPSRETGTLLCSHQPDLLLPGPVSSQVGHVFTPLQQANSRLVFCKSHGAFSWAAPSLLSQISEGCFLLLSFIYVSEVCVVWGLVWAAGCFSWKKPWCSAGCPRCAVLGNIPSLETTLCFSKAWSQPSSTKQPVFFSGFLPVDPCTIY